MKKRDSEFCVWNFLKDPFWNNDLFWACAMCKNRELFYGSPLWRRVWGLGCKRFIYDQPFLHRVWGRPCCFCSYPFYIHLSPGPLAPAWDPASVELALTTNLLKDEPSPATFLPSMGHSTEAPAFRLCKLEALVSPSSQTAYCLCLACIMIPASCHGVWSTVFIHQMPASTSASLHWIVYLPCGSPSHPVW